MKLNLNKWRNIFFPIPFFLFYFWKSSENENSKEIESMKCKPYWMLVYFMLQATIPNLHFYLLSLIKQTIFCRFRCFWFFNFQSNWVWMKLRAWGTVFGETCNGQIGSMKLIKLYEMYRINNNVVNFFFFWKFDEILFIYIIIKVLWNIFPLPELKNCL